MKYNILFTFLIFLCVLVLPATAYTIDGNTVYENSSVVNLTATPHTLASSGWIYFNDTSHTFNGDFNAAFGFNTSVAKPTRAELHSPHWVNTTTDHELFLYNVTQFQVYYGDDLDYGNSYNTFQYSGTYQVEVYNETTMELEGYETVTSNVSFDSSEQDGSNYTIYWHTRHDTWTIWKDKTHVFQSVTHDYEGYDKWYYVEDVNATAGQSFLLRVWVDVPIGLNESSGKFYHAVWPSSQTISEAIAAGHFYSLDPWWNSSWSYFKVVTINQTMVNDTIGNVHYTMLVEVTDTDLRDHAQSDADDIVFVTSDNTSQLAHTLSDFNSTTGYYKAYVNVTDISNVTSINMYYNNSGATNTEDKAGTWGVNASGVWLMDEGTGSYANDSSGNDNNGTLVGPPDWVADGLDFVRADVDYIQLDNTISFADGEPWTYVAYIDVDFLISYFGLVGNEFVSTKYTRLMPNNNGNVLIYNDANQNSNPTLAGLIQTGEHQVIITRDSSSIIKGYRDGSHIVSTDRSGVFSFYRLFSIGATTAHTMDGRGQFISFYDRALSVDEIATQYNNTEYPTLFISFGAEQSGVDTTDPTYSYAAHNTTTASASVKFSIQYNDTTALHTKGQYIFATNNTGSWVNESAVNWTATPEYANITKALNSTVDATIGYRWYANDSAGNSNDTGIYTLTVTAAISEYTPPTPVSLSNTTGNHWVNFTWSAGSGNNTDSYNVSQNSTWVNGSSTAFNNSSVSAHGYSNIIVYAYNSTGTGTLSSANVTDNVTVPNNIINISNISASYSIDEGDTLSIDADYTDADSDTPTFNDNSSEWNVNSATGIVSWVTGDGDDGTYYYYINVTDGYGSSDQYNFTVTVNDTLGLSYVPPTPISLANTTGNFWVNFTWASGSGNITDSYNVSQNGTWVNGSSTAFNNSSVSAHGYSNIIVYAYNSSGTGTLSSANVTDNVTVPNNIINISNISASYSIDEGDTLSIDADYTDADSDTPTFNDNSSEWNVNSATGIVSWLTTNGDDGTYHYYINVSDGYGSSDQYNFTVTVNDTLELEYTPPAPVSLSNITGNFWVNHTWNVGNAHNLPSDGIVISGGDGGGGDLTDRINNHMVALGSDDTLWAVFLNHTKQVRLVNSTDFGVTWNTPINVTDSASNQNPPSIALDSNDIIHIVWSGYGWGTNTGVKNIQYRNYTTSGFGAQYGVTDNASTQDYSLMALDSNDTIHVLWNGGGNIQYRNHTSSGWGTQEAVTSSASTQSVGSCGIDSSDTLHVIWCGQGWGVNTTTYDVQYRNRTSSGWGTQEDVTDNSQDQTWPAMAIDASNIVHVTWWGKGWQPHPTGAMIQYRNRSATGWDTQETVSTGAVGQGCPTISLDYAGTIHIVWYATETGISPSLNDIMYRSRTSSGWGTQEEVTNTTCSDRYPSLIFATYPKVSGKSTNILDDGCAFIWTNTTQAGLSSVRYAERGTIGNITDSYNVSVNGTWYNGTTNTYYNNTGLLPHGWSNITVYAYNSSINGTLSITNVSQDTQVPNNVISISNISASYSLNESETLSIDADATDADSDTPTFNDNSSEWNVNSATGGVSWVTTGTDSGTYYYYINVSDGYGSTDQYNFTVTVNDTIYAPTVELLSMTPGTICLNCTGNVSICYAISHDSSGLNNTSVSFIYKNYDHDLSDSNHSIRPPSNNLSSVWNFNGRILRAANRNESLNFENNATITGGDTYTWSGLDENSTRLIIVPVNNTYTLVYINGTVHDIMPQMWYIDRSELQEAEKTTIAIHRHQNLLVKFWNYEIFKGNTDFLGVGYTDTNLDDNPSLWPSDDDPVNYYYLNSSYDPTTGGDPLTSGYAVYMGSANASIWIDHVYSPHTNSSYVRGFINNTLLHSYINTTNISYLLYTSDTPAAKPFYINTTNAATSSNVSFADTGVMWAGDTAPYAAQPYTPNIWFAFMKTNTSFDHKLYAADNNDNWANSTINSTNITSGLFPPTKPTFYSFHNGFTDNDMNGTYSGTFDVQLGVSSDPDGGVVTHNLTLHYGANNTYLATINNTFTGANGVFANITFDSTPYYSAEYNYTMRVIATDDESETETTWLGVNFTLYITPDPTTLQNTTYNHGVNFTWAAGGGAVSDSYNVSMNTTWYNGSSLLWANNSTIPHGSIEIIVYAYNESSGISVSNITDNVTVPNNAITITNTSDDSVNEGENVYVDYDATDPDSDTPTFSCNRTDLFTDFSTSTGIGNWTTGFADAGTYYVDFGVSDGYGSTDNYTMTITVSEAGAPGIPTNLQNTTGNFWVNYTWSAGINTDTFNVSQNSTWVNGSSTAFNNTSVSAHGWSNITVHGYNSTSDQTSTGTSQNTQVPNNAITLIDISASYSIDEGDTLPIDANVTDADGDSPTFNDNSSEWNINSATGIVSWVTGDGDDGTYYYYINVTDGYGSSDQYNFTVTVNDTLGLSYVPPTPISLANTTGNFWVNFTWASGSGNITDSYNVSQNSTWINGSSTAFNNTSVSPHGTSTIIVYAYNNTDLGAISTGYITDSVTVPNNAPVLSGIPDQNTNEDTNLYDVIDLDTYYSDADSDAPTFSVESNNQSANVTIDISGSNTVDFILAANWHGTAQIVFNVTDGYGGSDNDTMILTVYSVNDAPVMDAIGAINENENETVIIDVDATDPDDDTLTYACNRTDLFTDFDTGNGMGTWGTNYSSAGIYYVNFSVDDGNGGEDYEVVTITITDIPLVISTNWNNVTGASLSISIEPGNTVAFGVTTNRTATNISWYNGSTFLKNDTATSQGNLSHQFDNKGTFYINVSAVDAYDTTTNTTFAVSVGYPVPSVVTYSPDTPHRSDNGTNVTFNVTFSQTGNITWYLDGVQTHINYTTASASYTNTTGVIGGPYNVTASFLNDNGSVSQTWLWAVTTPLDNAIPLSIFIMWSGVMCVGALIGFISTGLIGITSSLLTLTIAYMNSKNIINGNVVQYFGGISSTDTIVTGSRTIESLPLSYIYLFVALVMLIIFILHVKNEVTYQLEPDIGDIDYE